MSLETVTYISDLVATNPVSTDGIQQGDDHLRNIKSALLTTFPSVTGAVTATHTGLGRAGTAFTTAGTIEVAPNGSTTSGQMILDGITSGTNVLVQNTSVAAGAAAMAIQFTNGGTTYPVATGTQTGVLAAHLALDAPTIKQGGNALLPTGMIVMWSGSIASIPAGWLLCDGTSGTPDLRGKFIEGASGTITPGTTGGANTQSATTSSSGSHSHTGGTGAAGAITPTATTGTNGSHTHGGTQGHSLVISEMPSHDHGLGGQAVVVLTGGGAGVGGSAGETNVAFTTQGSGVAHTHDITSDGSHNHSVTVSSIPDHTHTISLDGAHTHTASWDNRPAYYALAFIMKS